MNIAVVDDNPSDRSEVILQLERYARTHGVSFRISAFESGEDFLAASHPASCSLVFMDIYMKDMDGISSAKALWKMRNHPLLIFLTTSTEHYTDAFSVHAFDYLLKPVVPENMERVLNDALRLIAHPEPVFSVPQSEGAAIPYSHIRYICADSNYQVLTGDTAFRFRMTFSDLKKLLDGDPRFLVINRGILVNMQHIQEMQDTECRMDDGTVFPLNQRHIKDLHRAYISWQFSKRENLLTEGEIQ